MGSLLVRVLPRKYHESLMIALWRNNDELQTNEFIAVCLFERLLPNRCARILFISYWRCCKIWGVSNLILSKCELPESDYRYANTSFLSATFRIRSSNQRLGGRSGESTDEPTFRLQQTISYWINPISKDNIVICKYTLSHNPRHGT